MLSRLPARVRTPRDVSQGGAIASPGAFATQYYMISYCIKKHCII